MSKPSQLVSIIMATYNREHYIAEALNSIKNQSYNNWECLIIDDGGTDKTEEVIKPLLKKDSRFKFYKRINKYKKGLSGSRNYGLDLAKGDYIIFFDDDDVVHPLNLEYSLTALQGQNVNFCHYQKQSFLKDVPEIKVEELKIRRTLVREDIELVIRGEYALASCTVLWEKGCFNNVRFNENLMYAEEWECYISIIEKGFKGVSLENVLYYNRKHAISNTGKFWNKNPIQLKSKKQAIVLVASNLANKNSLTSPLKKYFTGLAISYRDLSLLKKLFNIFSPSQYFKIITIIKYYLYNLWRIYIKTRKKLKSLKFKKDSMRVGGNPQKGEAFLKLKTNHRIVIVVFIPQLEGYYKDMFEVVKVSINSLIKTIPTSSAITIVDNGSCEVVVNYLETLFKDDLIDALQLLKTNIGKIDALMGGARASREPIITLTDCDILFKTNWVSETIKLFNTFENVGSVSPIPTRTAIRYYTFTVQEAILRKKNNLKFESIPENFEAYNKFLESINWDKETDKAKLWPVIFKNNTKAVMGSDHQVLTLRRDIFFNTSPSKPSFTKVGKESEREYVDLAIDLSGRLRLSTHNFYAFHMGNTLEEWMLEEYDKLESSREKKLKLMPELRYNEANDFWYKVKKRIFKKVFKLKIPSNY